MSAGTEDRIINQMATDTDDDELLDPTQGAAATPVYKMYEGARIPVSKKAGNLWKSRRDASQRKLEQTGRIANWEEAIRYYKNDQRANREGTAAKTRRDRGKSGRDSARRCPNGWPTRSAVAAPHRASTSSLRPARP
jgi:hypothetical protein